MSTKLLDMNSIIGTSYSFLKKLFGDRVSVPEVFVEHITKPTDKEGEGEGYYQDDDASRIPPGNQPTGDNILIDNGKVIAFLTRDGNPIESKPKDVVPPAVLEENPEDDDFEYFYDDDDDEEDLYDDDDDDF